MLEIKNRRGFIRFTDAHKGDWNKLYIFFKDFRPTHIEFRHWENDVWYFYGVSPLFDEVAEGEAVPQYDVIFTRHEDDTLTYNFQRCK